MADSTRDNINTNNSADLQVSLVMRSKFKKWLFDGNIQKYSINEVMACMDMASEYAVNKKMSKVSFWELSHASFKSVYGKLSESKIFRFTERKTYKIFVIAGQMYSCFLKDAHATKEPAEPETMTKEAHPQNRISAENVIAWLVTQSNANGTLYLRNVLQTYMSALRSAPKKLTLNESTSRDVFGCTTLDAFDSLCAVYRAAPDYVDVNRTLWRGQFSAGLAVYRRYLEHLKSGSVIDEIASREVSTRVLGSNNNNLLFQKAVGWSLLHYGITIPQKYLDAFFSALGQRVDANCPSASVIIGFNDKTFRAKVYLNGQATQIRWTERDGIAVELRLVFISSYERFKAERNSDIGSMPGLSTEKSKEYIDVMAGDQSGELYFLIRDSKTKDFNSSAFEVPYSTLEQKITPEVANNLFTVLSSRYSSGFRLNSPIELVRFRKFYVSDVGEEVSLPDNELIKSITACGTIFDGKVYTVSGETKKHIKEIAENYFSEGAQAIFYEEFYKKNEDWLFDKGIVSDVMLKDIFRTLFSNMWFTQTYFGHTNATVFDTLESEILRVWGDDVLLTYEQVAERLIYIPLERIKNALGQNADFMWNSVETFSHVSRIDITDDDKYIIRDAAMRECNSHGYVSMTTLPCGDIEERNHDLSITAIHNAIFRICLSDTFDKKGKIITRKGDDFDAFNIMKEHCRTVDKCTLEDLLNFERELTGEVHRWIPMEAGNQVLVRIDKNLYIADKYVQFNVDAIDAVIASVIKGDYLPLKAFTTFGAFPDCGQKWNLFLLESYCRRFSQAFRFDTPSVNSRNAGAIIRKSCGMNYTEIMTDAVANSNVPLTNSSIGRFFYESGFTGRSTTGKASEIISTATIMRERRD